MIRFRAALRVPAGAKGGWTFLLLPRAASAKLPTRGRTAVTGTLNGAAFKAMLEPDGAGSHWLKVLPRLRSAAAAQAGDELAVELAPTSEVPEPSVPADLRKALAPAQAARATWRDITPAARQDWIHWITSAKKSETRERRVAAAVDMLGSGRRRVCCFDRSGIYSKGFAAPRARG